MNRILIGRLIKETLVNIENWVVFPDPVIIPNTTCNLYEAFGLIVPDLNLVDEKLRGRFGPYIIEDPILLIFNSIEKYIIMYLSISPRMKSWPICRILSLSSRIGYCWRRKYRHMGSRSEKLRMKTKPMKHSA